MTEIRTFVKGQSMIQYGHMSILISGSLAYDYIMDFPDSFKHHILPDQVHVLNVCFVVDRLKKNFGGTAGNIAYTMKLLGGDPQILATLGSDAEEYLAYLKSFSIPTQHIAMVEDILTASAYITTDKDDNQITAFFNGALQEASELSIGDVKEKIDLAIVAPTKKEAMMKHAKECYIKKIPFVFDPGQQVTALTSQELMQAIGQASFVIGNDYEMKLIEQKTRWDTEELLQHVQTVIITLGERGSIIRTKDELFEIASCPPRSVDDPTGAGDAYRAGFFTAYTGGYDLETCGQVGSVAAVYAVECYGTQNHRFIQDEFTTRVKEMYGKKYDFLPSI